MYRQGGGCGGRQKGWAVGRQGTGRWRSRPRGGNVTTTLHVRVEEGTTGITQHTSNVIPSGITRVVQPPSRHRTSTATRQRPSHHRHRQQLPVPHNMVAYNNATTRRSAEAVGVGTNVRPSVRTPTSSIRPSAHRQSPNSTGLSSGIFNVPAVIEAAVMNSATVTTLYPLVSVESTNGHTLNSTGVASERHRSAGNAGRHANVTQLAERAHRGGGR